MARTIAVSGELGSGKSSVAEQLAATLGARRVSTGAAQRQIAEHRGITTLELNRLSENDPTIDQEIDSVFRALAASPDDLVVDSRLAWHFLPTSFKVHLVVDPVEGARRVLQRPDATAEVYSTLPEALAQTGLRVDSERRRFVEQYGVDIFRLRNYDLVVDTTQASPGEVAAGILRAFGDAPPGEAGRGPGVPAPALLLAPKRVYPTELVDFAPRSAQPVEGTGARPDPGDHADDPIGVAYRRPRFSVVAGHDRLHAALLAGAPLLAGTLLAEDDQAVVPQAGVAAAPQGLPDRRVLERWEAIHHFRFSDDDATAPG